MDIPAFTGLTSIAVAIIAGGFAYITALSTKEKEIKLKKYEELGMDVFEFFEEFYIFNSNFIRHINIRFDSLSDTETITSDDLRTIYINNDLKPPEAKKARNLSIRLAFVDVGQKLNLDNFLENYESEMNKYLARNSVVKPTNNTHNIYSKDELKDVIESLKALAMTTKNTKDEITNSLSKKYHSTIGVSKSIILYLVISMACIILALYLTTKKPSETKSISMYEIHLISDK